MEEFSNLCIQHRHKKRLRQWPMSFQKLLIQIEEEYQPKLTEREKYC
jgi:hypothetical protein